MEDVRLGIVNVLAMIAHEIPQGGGDFVILLHSGYSKACALAFKLLSSLATLVRALLPYAALGQLQGAVPTLPGLAAASMIPATRMLRVDFSTNPNQDDLTPKD